MTKWRAVVVICVVVMFAFIQQASAQCSICTKTAMQLGEKPAAGLNTGIVYLMLAPFAVVGYIGFRWWKTEYSNNNTKDL